MFWLSGQLIGVFIVAACVLAPFAIAAGLRKKPKPIPVQRCPQPCLKHSSCLPELVTKSEPEPVVAWKDRPRMEVPGKFSALYPPAVPKPRQDGSALPADLRLWP